MNQKSCYGVLSLVFPLNDQGLREVQAACLECPEKVPCLKTALDTPEGLDLRTKLIDRAVGSGLRGWLKRWSEKKRILND